MGRMMPMQRKRHSPPVVLLSLTQLLLFFFSSSAVESAQRQFGVARRIRRQIGTGLGQCTPLTVFNGQVNYLPLGLQTSSTSLGSIASGTTAILTCNSGFFPSGSSSATCSNGFWNPTIGSCQSLTGGGLNTLGTVNPFGSTTTQPFGIGIGQLQQQQCLGMIAPLGGQIQYFPQTSQFGTYSVGTTAQLVCTGGTAALGSNQQATCQSNGQWLPTQLGPCQSGTGTLTGIGGTTGLGTIGSSTIGGCLPAVAPLNAQIQYQSTPVNGVYPNGASAVLQCLSGVSSTGQTQSFCSNSVWTPPFVGCTPNSLGIGTTTPGLFGGVNTGLNTGGQIGFQQGQCLVGMLPPLGGTLQYSNNPNQLQNFGGTTVGTLPSSGPFPSGTTATLICQQGVPTGTSTAVCMNGQWQPPMLSGCSSTGLSALGQSMTGLSSQLGVGTGQCLMGLAVLGGNVLYTSSSSTPTGLVGTTSATSQFGPFPVGTVAQAQCSNGQLPSGSATAVCQSNGSWLPTTLGSCLGTFGASGSNLFGTNIGSTLSPSILSSTAQGMACFFGMVPPLNGRLQYSNGQQLGPYPAGTLVSMLCNTGFVPSGSTQASCVNGQFQPSIGQCLQASANPPTSATSSDSSSSSASSQSSTTASSTTFGTTSPFLITAAGNLTGCFEMPQPTSGQFVYSPVGYKAPFPIGSTATLVCAQGTLLPDGSSVSRSAICQYAGWSQLQFDPCMPAVTTTTTQSGGSSG